MLLDAKQGGFIPYHLTIDTITTFSEQIYQNINNGNIEIATYIDLKRPLKMSIIIFFQKLDKFEIKNNNLNWITNYMTNRSKRTLAH